jgi:hypothetical protein
MSNLFPRKDDTLTTRNIIDSYTAAYQSVHQNKPNCVALDSRRFIVEGVQRDRQWVLLEVERLRQEALTSALDSQNLNKPTSSLFKLIRKLSRI